jgi:parvulin-like peptidyl-prolyl isomerase
MELSKTTSALSAALFFLLAGLAPAADMPDDVLLEAPQAKVTRADFNLALERVPPDMREAFRTSPRRVSQLVQNLLTTKVLAARARAAGLQPSAGMATGNTKEIEQALAAAELNAIDERAGREFDSKLRSLEPAVRENFLVAKDKYRHPEKVKISIIAIGTEGRGDDGAVAFARATRERILAGADFATVAKEVSQDDTSATEGGALPWMTADEMDPAIAKIAFAIGRPGEVSEPVAVERGYILIRLDDRRASTPMTFDEARPLVVAAMRADYIKHEHDARIEAIHDDPAVKVNEAAIDSLVYRVDSKSMRPPAGPPERPSGTSPK